MQRILFQGDSITDANRSRQNNSDRGLGYPTLVAAELGLRYPQQLDFINRGVSGNRSVDLYARIKADFINLAPDYLSILIGVNDVWHDLGENGNGVIAPKYERVYSMLIEELLEALPNVKIMILEPFVLSSTATEEHYDYFRTEVDLRAAAARRIAEKYKLTFVPLQDKFNAALELAPSNYWLADGVHPTTAGHALIAREWISAFDKISTL